MKNKKAIIYLCLLIFTSCIPHWHLMKKSVEIARPIAQDYGNVKDINTDVSVKPNFEMMKDSTTGYKMIVVAYPNKWKIDYGERIVVVDTETAVFIDAETLTPFEVSNGTEICKVLNREISEKLSGLRSKYHKMYKKRMENYRQEKKLFVNKLIEKARPVAMEYGKVDGKAPKIVGIEDSFQYEEDFEAGNEIIIATFVRGFEAKRNDYIKVYMDAKTKKPFFVQIRYEKGTIINQELFSKLGYLVDRHIKIIKEWGKE